MCVYISYIYISNHHVAYLRCMYFILKPKKRSRNYGDHVLFWENPSVWAEPAGPAHTCWPFAS